MDDSIIKNKWPVGWNYQTDNKEIDGFKGSWQCFSTCAWMLLSWLCPDKIKADDDQGLSRYLDDVEQTIGSPGIGEEVSKKEGIKGSTSYYFAVQRAGIQKWMEENGGSGKIIFSEKKIKFEDLPKLLDKTPVILNTAGMGGTRGHIVLAVGYTDDHIIVNDPFGDARENYSESFGEGLFYEKKWFKKFTGEKLICIYWEE